MPKTSKASKTSKTFKASERCSSLTCKGARCKKPALCGRNVCAYHVPDNECEDCPICMESMPLKCHVGAKTDVKSPEITFLRCTPNRAHVFHSHCLTKWFCLDKETCPTCRKDVPESIIRKHDPSHYERKKAQLEPLELVVSNVARFRIPRPIGMSDRDILDHMLLATVSAISQLP